MIVKISEKNELTSNTVYLGYTRLSRDEDKSNYTSIIGQKKMIKSHIKEKFNSTITDEAIYEDDNVSGYTFDRPDYNRLIKDIDSAVETGKQVVLVVKDLSRIGRNNPLTLLFLQEMKSKGVRIVLLGDNYDSFVDDDSMLGIKSWYNELYVKDISRKVKDGIKSRMKDGNYLAPVPYGYKRNPLNRKEIIIDDETAPIIRKIFQMYLQGDGYRKICIYLTSNKIPTPSMIIQRDRASVGKAYKKDVTDVWVQRMVQRIIRNDFYIGVLRQGKYKLNGINGKILKTDLGQHHVFENNHEPIISKADFDLAQAIAEKRLESNFRGTGYRHLNVFSGFLVCEDCGKGMVALNKEGKHKSYICGTYRRVGGIACTTHYILDRTLMLAIKAHLVLIRENLSMAIQQFNSKVQESVKKAEKTNKFETSMARLKAQHSQLSDELKITVRQKIKEMALNPATADIKEKTYALVEADLEQQIVEVNRQIKEITSIKEQTTLFQEGAKTALSVFDAIIAKESLDRKDLELLVDKITVSADKSPTIYLKANIEQLLQLDNGDDPDGNGRGNKATVTYKAGAVTKSFMSTVAINENSGQSTSPTPVNGYTKPLKEPLSTTRRAPTAFKAWAACWWRRSKAVIPMSSACRCRCLRTCWPNSAYTSFNSAAPVPARCARTGA